jgi:gamma-glutamylcyclotransferase (GGCT)/AIG2-like uncharacterized protein YtfP
MSWLSASEYSGHLGEAVSRFNEALDLLERDGTEREAMLRLSDALGSIQVEWSHLGTQERTSEVDTFRVMLARTLCADAQAELLNSSQVAQLLGLEPNMPLEGRRQAHDALISRSARSAEGADESSAHSIARLAERMCGVRSNPAHGEGSTEDPETVIPAQLLLVNLLLDRPDERLVIYGTLAPGRENHTVIEDLGGDYRDCAVHGRIDEVDGLPYFTWAPSGASIGAQLFTSKQLPEKWDDLDRFEGDGYKRRLIPATADGELSVASIYLSTADDWWSCG